MKYYSPDLRGKQTELASPLLLSLINNSNERRKSPSIYHRNYKTGPSENLQGTNLPVTFRWMETKRKYTPQIALLIIRYSGHLSGLPGAGKNVAELRPAYRPRAIPCPRKNVT